MAYSEAAHRQLHQMRYNKMRALWITGQVPENQWPLDNPHVQRVEKWYKSQLALLKAGSPRDPLGVR